MREEDKSPLFISIMMHLIVLVPLLLIPLFTSLCYKKEKPKEIITYIDLQAAAKPTTFHTVQKTDIPKPEPKPTPKPELPKVEPAPKPEPVKIPEPIKKTDPVKKKPPKPKKKKIEVSKKRIKRTDPTPTPKPAKPTKQLSPEEIAKQLEGAAPTTSNTGLRTSDGIPSWYYKLVQKKLFDSWQQPSGLSGSAGKVVRISIRVMKDGTIKKHDLIASSGIPLLDSSALATVENMGRVDPLPASFGKAYKDIVIDFQLTDQ